MKCSFCGNNVPDGSELCPECGMILSLDGGDDSEITVPVYTNNIFGSEPIKVPEIPTELEEDFAAEISAPEYNPDRIVLKGEDEGEDMSEEAPAAVTEEEIPVAEIPEEEVSEEEIPADSTEESSAEEYTQEAEEEAPEETVEEAPEEELQQEIAEEPAADSKEYAYEEEPTVIYEAPAYGDEEIDAAYTAQSEETTELQQDESECESFADSQQEETVIDESFTPYEEDDETVMITPVIVPVEDAPAEEPSVQKDEELEDADDDGDTYISSGKKGRASTVAILCLLLVCLVVAGGYIVKKVFPDDGTTITQPNAAVIATGTDATTQPTTSDDTTAPEQTTEPSVTDNITEDDTTAPDVTEPTTEPSTEPTTEPSTEPTTEPSTEPTTKPTTTKPTTTKPTTTRPTTTRPTTTKPTTTVDPYGINGNAKIQKPSSYLSQSYIGYTNRKVDMLGGPSSSSDWVQAIGKGGEVKVLAEQSGYSYVYSTRFGTYGWIKSSYISDSRPVESTTSASKDTVKPDKSGSGELMCTAYSLNLRTGPGTNYDSIKVIPVNYQVKIIGYKSGVSGWAYVTDLVSGKNGWVSTAYLTVAE